MSIEFEEKPTTKAPENKILIELTPGEVKEKIVTLAVKLKEKIIQHDTLEGTEEVSNSIKQLRQSVEKLHAKYRTEEWEDLLIMIDLTITGVKIGRRQRELEELKEIERDETKPLFKYRYDT